VSWPALFGVAALALSMTAPTATPDAQVDPAGGAREVYMDALPGGAKLRLLTMFGDAPFATCDLSFRMRVTPSGDVTIDRIGVRNIPNRDSPCNDIRACWERRDVDLGRVSPTVPWKGTLRDPDGKPSAHLELCFDTCAGRFEGRVSFDVRRDRRGWRMQTTDDALGTTGLELSGEWREIPPPKE
jgi:hypothetical protein